MLRSSEAALAAALRHTARPSQFTSPDEPDPMKNDLDRAALEYHRLPKPGKLEITPTKPLGTQRDLALAYSPGVAAACTAIVEDPAQAAELERKSVVSGTRLSVSVDLGGSRISKKKPRQ